MLSQRRGEVVMGGDMKTISILQADNRGGASLSSYPGRSWVREQSLGS
jgi:hypothetical protein